VLKVHILFLHLMITYYTQTTTMGHYMLSIIYILLERFEEDADQVCGSSHKVNSENQRPQMDRQLKLTSIEARQSHGRLPRFVHVGSNDQRNHDHVAVTMEHYTSTTLGFTLQNMLCIGGRGAIIILDCLKTTYYCLDQF
jgi:hypothetical protein